MREFSQKIQHDNDLIELDRLSVVKWLEQVRAEIFLRAKSEGLLPREFACTVAAAIIGLDYGMFLQIGDGAIVISEEGLNEYSPIFWPHHGEFANQTNFITQDNFSEILDFASIKQKFDKIALFTDGLERLILDFQSRTVYPPSISSIFEWLAVTPILDPVKLPSEAFKAYLSSDHINNRTDDDRTLVMATRRPAGKRNDTSETV